MGESIHITMLYSVLHHSLLFYFRTHVLSISTFLSDEILCLSWWSYVFAVFIMVVLRVCCVYCGGLMCLLCLSWWSYVFAVFIVVVLRVCCVYCGGLTCLLCLSWWSYMFAVFSQDDPSKLDNFGRSMLHGKGCDRWFDKSFTLVVCSNGRVSQ